MPLIKEVNRGSEGDFGSVILLLTEKRHEFKTSLFEAQRLSYWLLAGDRAKFAIEAMQGLARRRVLRRTKACRKICIVVRKFLKRKYAAQQISRWWRKWVLVRRSRKGRVYRFRKSMSAAKIQTWFRFHSRLIISQRSWESMILKDDSLPNASVGLQKKNSRLHQSLRYASDIELQNKIVHIQSAARRMLARKRLAFEQETALHRRRRWRTAEREKFQRVQFLEKDYFDIIVQGFVFSTKEKIHAENEIISERKNLQKSFKKWEKEMTRIVLNRPLGEEWLPQVDHNTKRASYMNVRTRHVQLEHPHIKYIIQNREREKAKADKVIQDRVRLIENYTMRLRDAQVAKQEEIYKKLRFFRASLQL